MGVSRFFKFMLALAVVSTVHAEDIGLQGLSQGACWYEEGEILKVASFNDKETLLMAREEVEYQVEEILYAGSKRREKLKGMDLSLHCGGYGASLVVKTETHCLWLRFNKGQLETRSVGGLESTKGDLCDGYKMGELIVGLKNSAQKEILLSESFQSMIKSIHVVSGLTLKVVLQDEFRGKEDVVMSELKKQLDLKYIEYNMYQHPVGESASLK